MRERSRGTLKKIKIEAENLGAAAVLLSAGVGIGLTVDHFYHQYFDGQGQCGGVDFDGHADLCGLYERQLKALGSFRNNQAIEFMGIRVDFSSYFPDSGQDFVLHAMKESGGAQFYVGDVSEVTLEEVANPEESLGRFWQQAIEKHLKFEDAAVGYDAAMEPKDIATFMDIVAAHREELNIGEIGQLVGIGARKDWFPKAYVFCDRSFVFGNTNLCGIYMPLGIKQALGYYSWIPELDYFEDAQSPVVTIGERHFQNLSESEKQVLDGIVTSEKFDY